MSKIFFIYILLLFGLTSCQGDKLLTNKYKYKYIEIEECTIPIPIKFNKIIKHGAYEYEIMIDSDNIQEIGTSYKISSIQTRTHSEAIAALKKSNAVLKGEIVEDRYKKGFHIMAIEFDSLSRGKSRLYLLYGKKSKIITSYVNENEIEKLLDYCAKTKK